MLISYIQSLLPLIGLIGKSRSGPPRSNLFFPSQKIYLVVQQGTNCLQNKRVWMRSWQQQTNLAVRPCQTTKVLAFAGGGGTAEACVAHCLFFFAAIITTCILKSKH